MTHKELIDSIISTAKSIYGESEASAIARLVAEKRYGLSRADLALEPDRELPPPRAHLSKLKKYTRGKDEEPESSGQSELTDPSGSLNLQSAHSPIEDKKIAENDDLTSLLTDLAAAQPVQYILGIADFDGLELAVGEGVLIPRPETEELVRWIANDTKNGIERPSSSHNEHYRTNAYTSNTSLNISKHYDGQGDGIRKIDTPVSLNILDIGTGSGAIAIALAKRLPEARVTAIDASPEALHWARINNELTGAGVVIGQADVLDENPKIPSSEASKPYSENPTTFDVVVSNPPYIPSSERLQMAPNVVKWEPASALFVPDDDSLVFYRAIAKFARQRLAPGGSLYFEIHENAAEAIVELLKNEGYINIEVREDINSRPRMVKCQ